MYLRSRSDLESQRAAWPWPLVGIEMQWDVLYNSTAPAFMGNGQRASAESLFYFPPLHKRKIQVSTLDLSIILSLSLVPSTESDLL